MRTCKQFLEATKGVNSWTVAQALSSLNHGFDWRSSTKSRMAEAWVYSETDSRNSYGASMRAISLRALRKEIQRLLVAKGKDPLWPHGAEDKFIERNTS